MGRIRWQPRIVIDQDLHHGEPCIRQTRVPVRTIIGSLADGMKAQEIIAEYPQLSEEDVLAALAYAAEVLHHHVIVPLASPEGASHGWLDAQGS